MGGEAHIREDRILMVFFEKAIIRFHEKGTL